MTTRLQYRNNFATVNSNGGVILIESSSWRAKRWAIHQVKRIAETLGVKLRKKDGAYYADYQKMKEAEYSLHETLKTCWVSPTVRDMKGKILDKGF